jgi:hypothetical protein
VVSVRKIRNMPIPERRAVLDPLVGLDCRFTWYDRYGRGSVTYPETGRLVAVAQPLMGTMSELVIVKADGYRTSAISTADLDAIELDR